MLVWTNDQVVHWVQSIGLRDYAGNLHESGVHGALLALDENFDHNTLALILQIPTQNTQVGSLLISQLQSLPVSLTCSHSFPHTQRLRYLGGWGAFLGPMPEGIAMSSILQVIAVHKQALMGTHGLHIQSTRSVGLAHSVLLQCASPSCPGYLYLLLTPLHS